jgi:hypothetical protein
MTWVVWRQHRFSAAVGAALLAAFAAVMVVTGLQMASQWHTALVQCTETSTCGSLAQNLVLGNKVAHDLAVLSTAVPAIIGFLCGAPLVAREIETGTVNFAWVQSITRTRWLLVKVTWLLLAAAVWGGAVSALVTWWSGPRNALYANAFQPNYFDTQGIAPVGYAVFAMALGITAGALIRRTLPAIAITLVGFIGMRLAIAQWVRPHYMHAITVLYSFSGNYTPSGAHWQVSYGVVSKTGQLIYPQNGADFAGVPMSYVPASCQALMNRGNANAATSCVQAAGFRNFITYQPANRYWAFQSIETGIFVFLAALLIAVMFLVLRRHDA